MIPETEELAVIATGEQMRAFATDPQIVKLLLSFEERAIEDLKHGQTSAARDTAHARYHAVRDLAAHIRSAMDMAEVATKQRTDRRNRNGGAK